MKKCKLLIFCTFASLLSYAQPQRPAPRPTVESPVVHTDNSVTFSFYAPKATDVKLSAQFAKVPLAMTKAENGVWSVKTEPIKPDMYPYSFNVDGVSVADPANSNIFPNEGFQNSILEVTGSSPLIHTVQNVPHGTVSYRYYQSPQLGTRPVVVYTPPGYETNNKSKYPVLYLHHGSTDTEETWTKVGRANIILDNLIAQGKAKPMIVVMPYVRAYPTISKSSGSLRNWDNLQEFEKDFYGNLMPWVEKNYRTINDKNNRAMAGFSGGGGTTMYLGFNHSEKFAYICGFAPGLLKIEFDRNHALAFKNPSQTAANLKLLWIGVGTEDPLYKVDNEFMELLEQKGIKYENYFTEGGHTWMNVKHYFSVIAPKLFK